MGKYDAQDKWAKENTSRISVKFFNEKDKDILDYLESTGNKNGTIRAAIRAYMENEKKNQR